MSAHEGVEDACELWPQDQRGSSAPGTLPTLKAIKPEAEGECENNSFLGTQCHRVTGEKKKEANWDPPPTVGG